MDQPADIIRARIADAFAGNRLLATFNDEVVVLVMIESAKAVAAVDSIAAVPGVDSVLAGAVGVSGEAEVPAAGAVAASAGSTSIISPARRTRPGAG